MAQPSAAGVPFGQGPSVIAQQWQPAAAPWRRAAFRPKARCTSARLRAGCDIFEPARERQAAASPRFRPACGVPSQTAARVRIARKQVSFDTAPCGSTVRFRASRSTPFRRRRRTLPIRMQVQSPQALFGVGGLQLAPAARLLLGSTVRPRAAPEPKTDRRPRKAEAAVRMLGRPDQFRLGRNE